MMGCVIVAGRVHDESPEDGLVTKPLHIGCATHRDPKVIPADWQRKDCRPKARTWMFCGKFTEADICQCQQFAEFLCDYPMGEGKTCDAPLCSECRVRQLGDDWGLDFCRAHEVINQAVRA